MHSTGEKVQWIPVAATSTAVARAARSISAASQEHAMPSWVGKIVAPGQNEWPWMQSSAVSNGMPRRVPAARSTATSMRSGEACRIEPTILSETTSARSPRASSCSICPAFSANVIRASRSSRRSSTGFEASWYGSVVVTGGLRSALAVDMRGLTVPRAGA